MLTKTEKELLFGFIDEWHEYQSNAGCNDFTMPNTQENRSFMRAMCGWCGDKETLNCLNTEDDEIGTMDGLVLDFIAHRLRQEIKDPKKK